MSILDDILNREVTRKEFLATLGLAVLALLGIPTLIGVFSGKSHQDSKFGYGSGPFGD